MLHKSPVCRNACPRRRWDVHFSQVCHYGTIHALVSQPLLSVHLRKIVFNPPSNSCLRRHVAPGGEIRVRVAPARLRLARGREMRVRAPRTVGV